MCLKEREKERDRTLQSRGDREEETRSEHQVASKWHQRARALRSNQSEQRQSDQLRCWCERFWEFEEMLHSHVNQSKHRSVFDDIDID